MKVYITFGQVHAHSVNGKTFDKDCVAVIEAETVNDGHAKAMELFNGKFHRAVGEVDESFMSFFPRGLIEVE